MSEVKYVPKKEVNEYKQEMMEALTATSTALKKDSKKGFSPSLVGSSRRNLVLRKGESLYDVDIQLNVSSKDLEPSYRIDILNELKIQLPSEWTFDQSTSVITARIKNEKSFDLALIKIKEQKKMISILDKRSDGDVFIWNEVKGSKKHKKRLQNIRGQKDWSAVRDEYKKLRSNQWDLLKEDKKPSYALYVEAVNNVYNHKG